MLVGAIWARAFYLVSGTVIGLIVALVLIPRLSNSPELWVMALAVFLALCVYASLLDRSPRGFMFMLAGFTAALVGAPAATDPTGIFDTAVARAEEIVIGVLASAAMYVVFYSQSVVEVVCGKLDRIVDDARRWIAEGLRAGMMTPAPRSVAIDLTELNLLATALKFEGTFPGSKHRMALRAVEDRLIQLLPLVSGIQDRLAALAREGVVAPSIAGLTERVAAWVAATDAEQRERLEPIVQEIRALLPTLGPSSTWRDMLIANLAARLIDLVIIWEESQVLTAAVHDPASPTGRALQLVLARPRPRVLHIDRGIAAKSAIVAGLVIVAGAVLTVATRWESGPLVIVFSALCCSLFASADDPAAVLWEFVMGAAIALPVAILYEFAILPRIDGFVSLCAVLFPVLIVMYLCLARPKVAVRSRAAIILFTVALALQPSFIIDFGSFMNSYIARTLGAVLALVGFSLTRTGPVQRIIQRIFQAGWKDLAALTATPSVPDRSAWNSRMLDRIAALLPRLAKAQPSDDWKELDPLADLRLGASIIELRRLRAGVDSATGRQIDAILLALGSYFRALSQGRSDPLPAQSIDRLDAAIGAILRLQAPADRYTGIAATVGLRRGLFPQAPAYQPLESNA
jgi:uncharacterized membrane protein YccC